MKKYLSILLLGLLFTGCTVTEPVDEATQETTLEEAVEASEVDTEVDSEVTTTEVNDEMQAYTLVENAFNEENVRITYLQMDGYIGELTQDYINQSLMTIVDRYKSVDYFESIEIKPVIRMATEETLCVTYEGIATISSGKTVEILHAVLLDVKSSNEITYSDLINDDTAVRQLIEEKVIEENLAESFEAEGIRVYRDEDTITFAYMPLDDSASSFIRVDLPLEKVKMYLNTEFGEHPAS